MKKAFLILAVVFVVSLAASQLVEVKRDDVEVSQVENQDSLLSFSVGGDFDSVEARITGVEEEVFDLRLADDSTGVLTAPSNVENTSFTVQGPGTYHLLTLNQTTLAYDHSYSV